MQYTNSNTTGGKMLNYQRNFGSHGLFQYFDTRYSSQPTSVY